jgi:hypothetical protein
MKSDHFRNWHKSDILRRACPLMKDRSPAVGSAATVSDPNRTTRGGSGRKAEEEAAPAGGSGGIGDGMSDMECWSC